MLVCDIGVNATTIISNMKPLYVNCSTILAHLYTRGYSLSSLIFCSWIHLHGFVKRSLIFVLWFYEIATCYLRPKDGYKVTVKISLCICVVLS